MGQYKKEYKDATEALFAIARNTDVIIELLLELLKEREKEKQEEKSPYFTPRELTARYKISKRSLIRYTQLYKLKVIRLPGKVLYPKKMIFRLVRMLGR